MTVRLAECLQFMTLLYMTPQRICVEYRFEHSEFVTHSEQVQILRMSLSAVSRRHKHDVLMNL